MIKLRSAFTLLLMVQAFLLQAQVDLTNTGTLYITGSGDILYINGALTNTNTAALTNNGNLYVRQNLTNNQASIAVGTGTLHLTGTIAQTIGGSEPFNTYNLVTDNAAGFTLNADLRISGTHNFTTGIITTSATPNYLTYQAGASYTGAADARHVNGWVKKIGNTDFAFPVGNGTYLRNVSLNNMSTSSEFNVTWLGTTPNTASVLAPIVLVDNNEYWNIVQVSGGNAEVAMNWDNSKIGFPQYYLTAIRAVNYSGGVWTNRGGTASGNINTTGAITSNAVNSFGFFTFGSIDFFIPVEFLSFTAQRKSGYSLLEWSTARELGTDHFEMERSDDGRNFYKIAATAAANRVTNHYQYQDHLPLNGTAWYRIRSVDTDGKSKYSSIAVVTDRNSHAGLYVVGNPVSQYIFISATGNYMGNYDYSVMNAAGQLMQKGKINAAGIVSIPLHSSILPGTYIVDLSNEKHRLTQKIIVR